MFSCTQSADADRLHQLTIDGLARRGIVIRHPRAQGLLCDAGARLNRPTQRIAIPPDMVENSLATLPSRFVLAGRAPEHDRCIGVGLEPAAVAASGADADVDRSGVMRCRPTCADLDTWIDTVNALPPIVVCSGFEPADIDPASRVTYLAKTLLVRTPKHTLLCPDDTPSLRKIIDMALVIRETRQRLIERPLVTCRLDVEPVIPISRSTFDRLLLAGEAGMPVQLVARIAPGTVHGAGLASRLTAVHRVMLTLITVSQLANPGTPVIQAARFAPVTESLPDFLARLQGMLVYTHLIRKRYALPVCSPGLAVAGGHRDRRHVEKTVQTLALLVTDSTLISGAGGVNATAGSAQLKRDADLFDLLLAVRRRLATPVRSDGITPPVDPSFGPGRPPPRVRIHLGDSLAEDRRLEIERIFNDRRTAGVVRPRSASPAPPGGGENRMRPRKRNDR